MTVNIFPQKDSNGNIVYPRTPFATTDGLKFRGTGIKGTIPKGTLDCIEYQLTEIRYLNGLELFLQNQEWDDDMELQVVDKTGVGVSLGLYTQEQWDAMGGECVLDEFGTHWNIATDSERQGPYILPYPAMIVTDLYLRICYTSTGDTNDVKIKVNFFLHKKPV